MPETLLRPLKAPRSRRRHKTSGFTLMECLLVCLLVGVMATLTLSVAQNHRHRVARLDAVQALMRIQQEQEGHRALHGLYAQDLAALRGTAPVSRQGFYTLGLLDIGAERYTAVATARGAQTHDSPCATLTLMVDKGYPQIGPSTQCWNR